MNTHTYIYIRKHEICQRKGVVGGNDGGGPLWDNPQLALDQTLPQRPSSRTPLSSHWPRGMKLNKYTVKKEKNNPPRKKYNLFVGLDFAPPTKRFLFLVSVFLIVSYCYCSR